ncbi:MAG: glutamate--tRNA ligase [bacterium]|nr:glutamate--tRNA ligase [bacterium]
MEIRTRFAPSPTGFLHIGGLRTALYAFFFARKNNGKFILRVEDTDQSRLVPGATEALIQTLDFMGVQHDEGPFLDSSNNIVERGKHGPYIQSKRIKIYAEYVSQLLESGNAYRCFCTSDRLNEMRENQQKTKQQPKYDRTCAHLADDELQKKLDAKESFAVRMKIPEGETTVNDLVYGTTVFQNVDIDDQVIIKSDGFPTYHFAVVVDDHLMNISHVIRGEDWLTSTAKHIILYDMFGWEPTVFAHLPNLLNPDKKKLSKRQGDVAVEDFLNKGYLPDALNNFVSTLGYNPKGDEEIYSMKEFEELFDITKVNRGGAIVNYEKLSWMNQQYIKVMGIDRLLSLVKSLLEFNKMEVDDDLLRRIITIEHDRLERLNDILIRIPNYQKLPDYAPSILVWKKSDREDAIAQIHGVLTFLKEVEDEVFEDFATLEERIKRYIEHNGLQNGNVLWPMRVALSGQSNSPTPFELAWVFGKIETIKRLEAAIGKLS